MTDTEPDYLKAIREEKALRESPRGRQFLMCRGMDKFKGAVESIPMPDEERQELLNMANVLLRLAVIKNEGRASSHKVPAF